MEIKFEQGSEEILWFPDDFNIQGANVEQSDDNLSGVSTFNILKIRAGMSSDAAQYGLHFHIKSEIMRGDNTERVDDFVSTSMFFSKTKLLYMRKFIDAFFENEAQNK